MKRGVSTAFTPRAAAGLIGKEGQERERYFKSSTKSKAAKETLGQPGKFQTPLSRPPPWKGQNPSLNEMNCDQDSGERGSTHL